MKIVYVILQISHLFLIILSPLKELSNPRQRDRLLSAMMILKKSIGLLSTSMQVYLSNPTNLQTKVSFNP